MQKINIKYGEIKVRSLYFTFKYEGYSNTFNQLMDFYFYFCHTFCCKYYFQLFIFFPWFTFLGS